MTFRVSAQPLAVFVTLGNAVARSHAGRYFARRWRCIQVSHNITPLLRVTTIVADLSLTRRGCLPGLIESVCQIRSCDASAFASHFLISNNDGVRQSRRDPCCSSCARHNRPLFMLMCFQRETRTRVLSFRGVGAWRLVPRTTLRGQCVFSLKCPLLANRAISPGPRAWLDSLEEWMNSHHC